MKNSVSNQAVYFDFHDFLRISGRKLWYLIIMKLILLGINSSRFLNFSQKLNIWIENKWFEIVCRPKPWPLAKISVTDEVNLKSVATYLPISHGMSKYSARQEIYERVYAAVYARQHIRHYRRHKLRKSTVVRLKTDQSCWEPENIFVQTYCRAKRFLGSEEDFGFTLKGLEHR